MKRLAYFHGFTWSTLALVSLGLGCEDGSGTKVDRCPEDTELKGDVCLADYSVRVNSVGFLANRVKRATFGGTKAAFSVHKQSNDEEAFSGTAEGPVHSPDTDEEVFLADFSSVVEPGEYYVKANGGRSPTFVIGTEGIEHGLQTTMLGLYAQRCGEDVEIHVEEQRFFHASCHLAEASMERIGTGTKDDTGGWHDAGDYGKYANNGAFAAAFLLKAYEHFPALLTQTTFEIPEKGGEVPDVLDEARVELEWLLKVQLADGSFAHKVTALNFEGLVMPSMDIQQRYFISTSSNSTAASAAVLAQAARLFEEFDADFAGKCLTAARAGQDWLDSNPGKIAADQSGVKTGGYDGGGDGDERLWALAELWETTGDTDFLDKLEARLPDESVDGNFDWSNMRNLGLSTYLRSKREGRSAALVSQVAEGFLAVADAAADRAADDAYGRGFGAYYWGVNGVLARLSFNLITAYYVEPEARYLDAIQLQVDHLLGRNFYGRSFVTGLGANSVQHPHHRPSQADGPVPPWPGLLIGGPHTRLFSDAETVVAPFPALTWTDQYENYLHNEVAINWNTALTYAFAALLGADEDAKGCDSCIIEGSGGAGGAGGSSN